jgi:hypothetical protein
MSSDSSSNTNLDRLGNGKRMDSTNTSVTKSTRVQGIFWIATIPENSFEPKLHDSLQWIRGQLECGGDTGYKHWQLVFAFKRKGSLRTCQSVLGKSGHYELTKSAAANEYVFKESTRVSGTQFELGNKPFLRNW